EGALGEPELGGRSFLPPRVCPCGGAPLAPTLSIARRRRAEMPLWQAGGRGPRPPQVSANGGAPFGRPRGDGKPLDGRPSLALTRRADYCFASSLVFAGGAACA